MKQLLLLLLVTVSSVNFHWCTCEDDSHKDNDTTSTYLLPLIQSVKIERRCSPVGPSYAGVSDVSDSKKCEKELETYWHRRHPDQFKSTPEILKTYGYESKTYNVVTKDSYLLTVFRIVGVPKKHAKFAHKKTKMPVLINHGLVAASDCWLTQPIQRTMPIKLANAGFDVWLGNSRGSSYSLNHTYLDYDADIQYWDFSLHELGIFDVPAVTSKIIAETGFEKIMYVGYSMGTTEYLIALSELPEMNRKFEAGFMLTPTAYMGHGTSGVHNLAKYVDSDEVFRAVYLTTNGRFRSTQQILDVCRVHASDICAVSAAQCGLCRNMWFMLHGYSPSQVNKSALPMILSKLGDAGPVKVISHFAQLVSSCRFQKYSYAEHINKLIYGTLTPPEYNLSNVKAPLYFYSSKIDNLVVPHDMDILVSKLSRGVLRENYRIQSDEFTHLDFSIGIDADKFVYDKLLQDMSNHKRTTSKT